MAVEKAKKIYIKKEAEYTCSSEIFERRGCVRSGKSAKPEMNLLSSVQLHTVVNMDTQSRLLLVGFKSTNFWLMLTWHDHNVLN